MQPNTTAHTLVRLALAGSGTSPAGAESHADWTSVPAELDRERERAHARSPEAERKELRGMNPPAVSLVEPWRVRKRASWVWGPRSGAVWVQPRLSESAAVSKLAVKVCENPCRYVFLQITETRSNTN